MHTRNEHPIGEPLPRRGQQPALAETDERAPDTVILPQGNRASRSAPRPVTPVESNTFEEAPPQHKHHIGDTVHGFRLVERLGRGAFAEVYLAEQEAIAGRRVVLKISSHRTPEPDRLGRLQHPNVVPIHSVHHADNFELICMPYLGRTTLGELLVSERRRKDPSYSTFLAPTATRPGPPTPFQPHPNVPRDTVVRAGERMAGVPLLGDVRAVLRLLSDLAAGLDHAHRRGILHLDIKPANVLIADTGEPMLLDFNLAHDTNCRLREAVGGTIPYMAPEQLAEVLTRQPGKIDERTDLFSLGAVAFELLTTEQAFQVQMLSRADLQSYLEQRQRTTPSAREKNPAISPAVDAIVRKLLAPNPADRYQTALELKTDLDRQLADLPLAFAADRSIPERYGKWRRRNPWLPLRLAAVSLLGIALGLGVLAHRRDAAAREAVTIARAESVRAQLPTLRIDLAAPGDSGAIARGREHAVQFLGEFGLPNDPNWRQRPEFSRLPAARQAALAADLGEVLLLLANARWNDRHTASAAERESIVKEVGHLNRTAEACFEPGSAPPFVYAQRTELSGSADHVPAGQPGAPVHPRDFYLESVGLIGTGRYHAALGSLEQTVARDPGHAAAHFALGYCRHQLGQYARALERYDTAHALLPRDPRPVFNRGLVYGLQKKHAAAEREFGLAVTIDPTHGESYRNRAVARLVQGKRKEAEVDLTLALEHSSSALQVYQLRAQVRAQLGDHRGAERDRAAARQYEPRTESDFLTRGRTQLPKNPKGALADFEAAARLNPHSLAALQNQAHVHSEYLKDDKRSLALVTRAVELYPEYAPARAGRAVLLARLGDRDAAHKEAEAACGLSDDPTVSYQVAGVYARTSARVAADSDRAFALLRQAIRDGFRDVRTLETDPDLDPIRRRPTFAPLANALRDLCR